MVPHICFYVSHIYDYKYMVYIYSYIWFCYIHIYDYQYMVYIYSYIWFVICTYMIANIWFEFSPYMIDNFDLYMGDHICALIYALAPGIHMLPTYDHMFVYMVYRHMIHMPVYGPIWACRHMVLIYGSVFLWDDSTFDEKQGHVSVQKEAGVTTS